MEKDNSLTNTVCFAIGQIPWICRQIEYGHSVSNFGGKHVNLVAITPADRFNRLNNMCLKDISVRPLGKGEFTLVDNFLSLTLSVDNQIIHPARCYGLWQRYYGGRWASSEDVPYFYRDFDEKSAENIRKLDADYSTIRNAVRKHFPDQPFTYMLSYLELEKLNHNSEHGDDILASLRDSSQLWAIKTPTLVGPEGGGSRILNTYTRFFTDDIPYGLLIAKAIAEKLNVEVPFIAEVITWSETMRGEKFLINGKINEYFCLKDKYTCGIPASYGITHIKDIIE
jgi:opine dehydrogenase